MTPLDKTLKRWLRVQNIDYVVTLSPESLKLTRKGRRLGIELKWVDITSGASALAVALQASVGRFDSQRDKEPSAAAARSSALPRKPAKRRPRTARSR